MRNAIVNEAFKDYEIGEAVDGARVTLLCGEDCIGEFKQEEADRLIADRKLVLDKLSELLNTFQQKDSTNATASGTGATTGVAGNSKQLADSAGATKSS